MEETKYAVIYARISSDDGNDISVSIKNQINICKEYAIKNNIIITDIYTDDGYTGTNFNRPEFNRLLEDIKLKKIKIIISKDLSRIGRNFIKTSELIEDIFPKYNVRYISVNDNYDSINQDDDIGLPIINFINGMYAKECSKKRRQIIDKKAKEKTLAIDGIYGYIVDKGNLIVDEDVRPVINYIFNSYSNNMKINDIITNLINMGYSCPSYHKEYELNSKFKYKTSSQFNWTRGSIYRILKSYEYIGYAVNKKVMVNKYTKKRNIRDQQVYIENNHESIISKELFDYVQLKLQSNKKDKVVEDSKKLKGILYSEDGKAYIYRQVNHNGKISGKRYILCDLSHRIDAEMVHKILYKDVINIYKLMISNQNEFIKAYNKKINNNENTNKLELLQKEKNKLDEQIKILFEQLALEQITEATYNNKLTNIKIKITNLEQEISNILIGISYQKNQKEKLLRFISNLSSLQDIDEIALIKHFISKVIVIKKADKLKFKIIYKFEM